MASSEKETSDSEEEIFSWKLDTLPPEIFLHICSFLSAKFVINVLSLVCQQFKDLIEDDVTWKMRIFEKWPKTYPLVPSLVDIDWKEACIAREEHHFLWGDPQENMRKYHLFEAHFGAVNVVKLLENGRICASGGRDSFLKLWNLDTAILEDQPYNTTLENMNTDSLLINAKGSAHANAWIWDLEYDSCSKNIFSGGFDCKIRIWNLENPTEAIMSYTLSSPILCLAYSGKELASGCCGRIVTLFDPRVEKPVLQHVHHKKSVLCAANDEKYIITGSEDKTIIIYDKVARKVLKTLEFDWFPLSMSYGNGQLFVGDVNNSLYVIDPAHGEFNLLYTFDTGHTRKVTGVQHSLGSIITCSADKTIRILEPHKEPELIYSIECNNEVSRISAYDTILASANVDDSITVWIPNEKFTA